MPGSACGTSPCRPSGPDHPAADPAARQQPLGRLRADHPATGHRSGMQASEVLDTYVYNNGIIGGNWGIAAAAGLVKGRGRRPLGARGQQAGPRLRRARGVREMTTLESSTIGDDTVVERRRARKRPPWMEKPAPGHQVVKAIALAICVALVIIPFWSVHRHVHRGPGDDQRVRRRDRDVANGRHVLGVRGGAVRRRGHPCRRSSRSASPSSAPCCRLAATAGLGVLAIAGRTLSGRKPVLMMRAGCGLCSPRDSSRPTWWSSSSACSTAGGR